MTITDKAPDKVAVMPQAVITEEMLASMQAKAGVDLRIDHSVNIDVASRVSVTRFTGGIGDINTLWTDPERAGRSPYGAPVAPPAFIIGCFSGIQFGWPGLGSFHSQSHITFERPVYYGDHVNPTCRYEGFDGPADSNFAGRTVTDRFTNTYTNQRGEQIATIAWKVINYERGNALERKAAPKTPPPVLPHDWSDEEVAEVEARVLAEVPRGSDPRWWDDIAVGDELDIMTKGPIGLTDEIAFVSGGGTPIPRLKAHAAALHDYAAHPAWAFRDPITHALEPIYSVHYNVQAALAMGVPYAYDVGFQRQCWQLHQLTHWAGDDAWIKEVTSEYRKFVHLGDVVELCGKVVGKRVDADGEHVVDIVTSAVNQRGERVMPGTAIIALPTRGAGGSPALQRRRQDLAG